MKWIGLIIAFLPIFAAAQPTDGKLKVLYNSLDPTSIGQHLAFYELYSDTHWGKKALQEAARLLSGRCQSSDLISGELPYSGEMINTLVRMVNKGPDQEMPHLDPRSIHSLEQLSQRLSHQRLKGHSVWTDEEVLHLPLDEIDLARGLFLSQFGNDRNKILAYEAMIDLMALQILCRLSPNAKPEEVIHTINSYIFDELGFRFPPHSLFAKEIDRYTFLPSVIDSKRGVCLGVSILYLCLAQRLSLPLEMITPPGHIYVRYRSGDQEINIETTARGIHLDSEDYLSMHNRSLQQRTIREVIGMAHFNQASIYWQNSDYQKALDAYQKAEPYMKDDPLLKELMGYILLLTGNKEKGEQHLNEIKNHIPPHAFTKSSMAEDYLSGNVDAAGIAIIFTKTEEDRQSILTKKEALEEKLQQYPRFRAGILNLASLWLQLHRLGEALETLETYQALEPTDPESHYMLGVLYTLRKDFPKAWHHLHQLEAILKPFEFEPNMLKELRRELLKSCPE